jgi:hypothetical protein
MPSSFATRHSICLWLSLGSLLLLSFACSLLPSTKPTPTLYLIPTALPLPSSLPPTPTITPQPLPPTFIGSNPPAGSEIPLAGPITLYFSQPMDRPSVESALSGQPPLSGSYSWVDGSTVTFTPDQPFPPETSLTITIAATARSVQDQAIPEPVNLSFRTIGLLRLAQSEPAPNAADVNPASAIMTTFNRPVASPGTDPASLPVAFTLEPAATGHGEWMDASTYIFFPDPPLAGGVVYIVRMNPDLHGADGIPLGANDWTFTTVLPHILSIAPAPYACGVRLDIPITITFDQPMDPTTVEVSFALIDEVRQAAAGQFSWNADHTVITFRPDYLLRRSMDYAIDLTGVSRSAGGTPLVGTSTFTFCTVDPLAVTDTDPLPWTIKPASQRVVITFNSFLPQDVDLTAFVDTTPGLQNMLVTVGEDLKTLYIEGDYVPGKNYQLTLLADLPDAWGGKLGEPYVLWFSIAPLEPQ